MIPVQAAKDNDISVKVEGINEQSVPAMNQEEKGVECNESQKIYIFKCLFFIDGNKVVVESQNLLVTVPPKVVKSRDTSNSASSNENSNSSSSSVPERKKSLGPSRYKIILA